MAFVQVKPVAVVRGDDEDKVVQLMEFIIGSSSDLTGLPDCAPGSLAYTADLSYRAQFDGTTWHQIGG